jgi:hypothetical protein
MCFERVPDRTPDAMNLSFVELRDTARPATNPVYHRQPDAQGRQKSSVHPS